MLLHLPLVITVYRLLRETDIYLFLASRLRKGFYIDLTHSFIYCVYVGCITYFITLKIYLCDLLDCFCINHFAIFSFEEEK